MTTKYVTYKRLSKEDRTKTQHGFDSQSFDIQIFLEQQKGYEVVGEFQEFISGAADVKPELEKALELCRKEGAMLVVAKTDRISRRVAQTTTLLEGDVKFKVACLGIDADNFQIGLFALLAEKEREFIRTRIQRSMDVIKRDTPEKLAKGEGSKWRVSYMKNRELGKHKSTHNHQAARDRMQPTVAEIKKIIKYSNGTATLDQISLSLNEAGITTPTGKSFTKATVSRIVKKFNIERKNLNGQA